MSLIDAAVPAFSATAYHDGSFVEVGDSTLAGRWSVLFFYPADFTFVCPTELGDLAEHHDELRAMGVEVFSVSTDTHFTHKAWHDSSETISKIRFPMVADPSRELTSALGVLRPSGLAERATFVIDPDGTIQMVEVTPEGVGRNAAELVRKIRAAQYVREHPGEVCPARWEEGEATLAPSLDLVGRI